MGSLSAAKTGGAFARRAPRGAPWYRSQTMSAAEKSYDEIVDLFARGGGAGAVLAFRPSAEAKARVQELLERSKRDGLSDDEQAELNRFGELNTSCNS